MVTRKVDRTDVKTGDFCDSSKSGNGDISDEDDRPYKTRSEFPVKNLSRRDRWFRFIGGRTSRGLVNENRLLEGECTQGG